MSGVVCRRCCRLLEGLPGFDSTLVDGCRYCSSTFGDDIDTGRLHLGIVRESSLDTRNDFTVFFEEFTGLHLSPSEGEES